MYTHKNYKTKKAFKDDVLAGKKVTVFQSGPFGGKEKTDGIELVEGPHYPEPHRWYAQVTLADGYVIKVK